MSQGVDVDDDKRLRGSLNQSKETTKLLQFRILCKICL